MNFRVPCVDMQRRIRFTCPRVEGWLESLSSRPWHRLPGADVLWADGCHPLLL